MTVLPGSDRYAIHRKQARNALASRDWDAAVELWQRVIDGAPEQDQPQAHMYLKYARFFLRAGGNLQCNLCGGTEFGDFNGRPLARCISCSGLERTRFMWLYMQHTGLSSSDKLLHIAPDNGLRNHLQDALGDNYTSTDINGYRHRTQTNFIKHDLCLPLDPLDKGGYDIIIHSHTIEHVPCNYSVVMSRLNRLLKPDGRQLAVIPIFPGFYSENLQPLTPEAQAFNKEHHYQANHVRKFGLADIESTFGMLFDFEPYRNYDMTRFVDAESLTRANVPDVFWTGLSSCTVFDIPRSAFRL